LTRGVGLVLRVGSGGWCVGGGGVTCAAIKLADRKSDAAIAAKRQIENGCLFNKRIIFFEST
jgi:hypothetical protein